MKAADIMTNEIVTVGPDTEVADVARALLAHRISAAPVVDAQQHVLGMISEGDLMRRAEPGSGRKWWLSLLADTTAEFVRIHGTRARDVMTRDVVSVGKETPLADIVDALESHCIKRAPVIEDGRLVGIVSRADVLRGLVALTEGGANAAVSSDDRLLRQRVFDLVRKQTAVSLRAVNIIAVRGRVYLCGVTETPEEREAVRVAAETVAGPGNVRDCLTTLSQVLRRV